MGSGGYYDQSLTRDAGELIVPVVGGVAGAQDPRERDCGAEAAFARHLAEDLQDLLARAVLGSHPPQRGILIGSSPSRGGTKCDGGSKEWSRPVP